MFKILKFDSNHYLILRGERALFGDLQKTLLTLTLMDIEADEIAAGLNALEQQGHEVAEYGINGTFIFSRAA